ncbi:type IV pilin protein [Candidatus Avelusimicrobium facis]|uniref:type IV pilin protein n=1 Tax=Candidatus Avelusimicrobium facis TaxID=3416203 RepID=UPI003D0FA4BF
MKNFSTGRLSRLFLNAVTLEGCCPGSVVVNKRNTTDPGTLRAASHSGMTSFYNGKKPSICFGGFTLIELLVVVLIIGVLTAVALPQYQKAVGKSEAAQLLVALKTYDTALEEYKLTETPGDVVYFTGKNAVVGNIYPAESDYSDNVGNKFGVTYSWRANQSPYMYISDKKSPSSLMLYADGYSECLYSSNKWKSLCETIKSTRLPDADLTYMNAPTF